MEKNLKHIISIDDDPRHQMLMAKLLESIGIKFHACANFSEFSKKFKTVVPDLILLDLNLGPQSGERFLQIKKHSAELSEIPVIVCSAQKERETVQKVVALGADDFLLKPVVQTLLFRKIKKHLSGQAPIQYVFGENRPKLFIEIECTMLAISESRCIVRSTIKLEQGATPEFSSDLLRDSEIKHLGVKSVQPSRPSIARHYDTRFSLVGLSDEEQDKIRQLKVSWK